MDDKVICTVSITNEILKNTLGKVLGWDKESFIALFHGMLMESHKGTEMFMKIAMGGELPYIPDKGTEVYVSIDNLGWGIDEKAYKDSPYNENGFIRCTVKSFTGYHQYSPLTVELPRLDPSDKSDAPVARIAANKWKFADSDFYEGPQPTPGEIITTQLSF